MTIMRRILNKAMMLNWLLPQCVNEHLLDREHRVLLKRLRNRIVSPLSSTSSIGLSNPLWVFVLLQYNHHDVTRECITSIGRIKSDRRIEIVIVDNASTDGSADALKCSYADQANIHLLYLDRNLGYARGNNVGYRYARDVLGAGFVFLVNNDITFPDVRIVSKIEKEFGKRSFSVLGPDIVVPRACNIHQNPMRYYLRTEEDVQQILRKSETKLKALEEGMKAGVPPAIIGQTKKARRREGALVLHGAAFVFSPIFLGAFDSPFDEGTFLYGEEDILCLKTFAAGHKLVFFPGTFVEHHAKASTCVDGYRDYWIFRLQNSIQSAKVYLAVLQRALCGKL